MNEAVSSETALVRGIDRFTDITGRMLAWSVLAMALITTAVVVLRYGFHTGSIALQEAITYLHGSLFMLGAAYALKHGAHVRVDIFYREFSPRSQAWVNALGGIVFLLPLCALVMLVSWGAMWGPAGMFMASPLTVIVVLICARFPTSRPIAILLSRDGRLPED